MIDIEPRHNAQYFLATHEFARAEQDLLDLTITPYNALTIGYQWSTRRVTSAFFNAQLVEKSAEDIPVGEQAKRNAANFMNDIVNRGLPALAAAQRGDLKLLREFLETQGIHAISDAYLLINADPSSSTSYREPLGAQKGMKLCKVAQLLPDKGIVPNL